MYDPAGTHATPDMSEEQAAKARKWETPAALVALTIIPYLVLDYNEFGSPWNDVLLGYNYFLWAFFIAEAVRMLQLTPNKWAWLRHNWVDVGVIITATPFLFEKHHWVQAFMLLRVLDMLPVVNRVAFRVTVFKFAIILFLLSILGAGLAFVDIEQPDVENPGDPTHYTLLQGIYWASTTISTVGYGDISPSTNLGMIITIPVQAMGLIIGAILVAAVIPWFDKEFAEGFTSAVRERVDKVTGADGVAEKVTASAVTGTDDDKASGTSKIETDGPAEPRERRSLDLSGYGLLDQMAEDQREIMKRLDDIKATQERPQG